MKLVIISGMPGAGKSELADAFREAGVPVIVMGDTVREETRARGLEPTPENTKRVMLELREKMGPGAIAIRCMEKLKGLHDNLIVIEGCRSISEISVFDDYVDDVLVVSVHASPKTRFERLRTRGRQDAPANWSVFRERDLREISVGLGGVIALSDIMLVNEASIEELRLASRNLVSRLIS